MAYEYTTDFCRDSGGLDALLNTYAERGWKAISVVNWNDEDYQGAMLLVSFERPSQPPTTEKD